MNHTNTLIIEENGQKIRFCSWWFFGLLYLSK